MSIKRKVKSLYGVIVPERTEKLPSLLVCMSTGDPHVAEDGVNQVDMGVAHYVDVSLIPESIRAQVMWRAKRVTKEMMESGEGLHPATKAELVESRGLAGFGEED